MTEKQKQWLAWVIVAVVLTAVSVWLGVSYPVPAMPLEFETEGVRYTTFRNLKAENDLWVVDDVAIDGTLNVDDMDVDLSAELEIDGALVDIGGGSGGTADGDNDLLVAGDCEVDDTLDVDGDIDLDGDGFDVNITAGFSIDGDAASNINVAGAGIDLTIESEAGRLVLKADEATADAIYIDANDAVTTGVDIDVGSVSGLTIDGGLTNIGGGTYSTADGDNDLGIDGDLEINGAVDVDGVLNLVVGTEHIGVPSIVSTAITYTAAAGGTGTVITVTDGEIWIVHAVLVNVTENFDCTGDDCTLTVGDGNDADGFIVLADTELQAADTEGTGFTAGWQGLVPATQGVYVDAAAGSNYFIYAPSGADETIDWAVDEADGETLAGGAATIYVIYTRIQ